MKQRIRHIIIGISATLLALPAGTAMAAPKSAKKVDSGAYEIVLPRYDQRSERRNQNFERFAQKQDRRISASQAKSAAQGRYPGSKFVNVQMSGRDTYRVRLQQKNGRIVDVYVDARTGRVKN